MSSLTRGDLRACSVQCRLGVVHTALPRQARSRCRSRRCGTKSGTHTSAWPLALGPLATEATESARPDFGSFMPSSVEDQRKPPGADGIPLAEPLRWRRVGPRRQACAAFRDSPKSSANDTRNAFAMRSMLSTPMLRSPRSYPDIGRVHPGDLREFFLRQPWARRLLRTPTANFWRADTGRAIFSPLMVTAHRQLRAMEAKSM